MNAPGLIRYGFEVRTALDLVAFELERMGLPRNTTVGVYSPFEELREDMANRLHGRFMLQNDSTAEASIYLFELEQVPSMPYWGQTNYVIAAFRNSLSHKSLMYRPYNGVAFSKMQRIFRSHFAFTRAYGVMPPSQLAWLALAAAANRIGRHDYGFYLTDRALLSPIAYNWLQQFCPIGIISGFRA